jgi:hypothetical protein
MGCAASKEKEPTIRKKSTILMKANGKQGSQASGPGTLASKGAQSSQKDNYNVGKGHKAKHVSESGMVKDAPLRLPTTQIAVSNTYNKEKLSDIVSDFQNKDDRKVCGPTPKSVSLFNKDFYSTKDWTPVQFAIYNKDLRAVRYFIEHRRHNRRLSTRKKILGPDETKYVAEAFPLIIAISNQDHAMLDYLWSMNELWDYEHLKYVLQIIFTRNLWADGMKIFLGSEATQDIYNSLAYNEKKQFILELFYRYLYYAPEAIKEFIKEVATQQTYSLIAIHYMMTEEKPEVCYLIEQALKNVTFDSYAKMKYEADKEFMKFWNIILAEFHAKGGEFTNTSNLVIK